MIKRDPNDVLDLYFRQCSVNVTTRDLAIMAATLANDGTNPITGKKVFQAEYVRDVLSVMNSCGMYDYAGEWAYEVGMPAKSGVSGCIIAVIPGQIGIGVFAPPLTRMAIAFAASASARRSRRSSSCTPSTIAPMSGA
jgi:glutaminase